MLQYIALILRPTHANALAASSIVTDVLVGEAVVVVVVPAAVVVEQLW